MSDEFWRSSLITRQSLVIILKIFYSKFIIIFENFDKNFLNNNHFKVIKKMFEKFKASYRKFCNLSSKFLDYFDSNYFSVNFRLLF